MPHWKGNTSDVIVPRAFLWIGPCKAKVQNLNSMLALYLIACGLVKYHSTVMYVYSRMNQSNMAREHMARLGCDVSPRNKKWMDPRRKGGAWSLPFFFLCCWNKIYHYSSPTHRTLQYIL
jgi:hypothetical protein